MSGLLLVRGLLFAGECFLASLLLPLLAFAGAALLRRRAALRHLVWTTMFGVLAVLPFVALLLPPRLLVSHVAAPAIATLPQAAPVAAPIAASVIAAPPSLTLSLSDLLTPENIVLLLVSLWLAGLAWQALRMGLGALGLMRLRRASIPFAVELETGCDVRLAAGEDGPSTFGILRPIVLLPRSAESWPAARFEAVLRHEAAHVARRDTASRFLARLVCAFYWLNPLLWLAARSLRRDAEIAADDAVLASGMTPSRYAEELVRLAAESRGIAPGIAMAGSPLAERVQSVLAQNSSRKGVTRMDIAKTVGLGLVATLMLGTARLDIAVAQDVAPNVSVAPVAPRVERNVEINNEVRAKAVEVQATTATIRARADAVAARARAKAEAETDPVKKEQYRVEAARVAAQSETLKADAARMAAESMTRLAQTRERALSITGRIAEDRQHAEAMTLRAVDDSKRAEATRVQAAESRARAAEMRARAGEMRELAQADAQIRRESIRALTDIGPQVAAAVAKALADAHVSDQVVQALADVHIDEVVAKAMDEARPAIAAAMERAPRAAPPVPPMPPALPVPPPPPPPFGN